MQKSIIATLKDYISLKRRGFKHAYEISGMDKIKDGLVGMVCVAAAAVVIIALWQEHRANADHVSEISALRSIVASCLSDSTGKHIQIGDEHYLCGIYHLGEFK